MTTVDTLAFTILMPHLAAFQAEHPGIALEFVVSSAMANLTRRDADVAIRPAERVPETLVGRRVCAIACAVYGPRGSTASPERGPWIGLDETLAGTAIARWLRISVPADAALACRVDSLLAAREAVLAGMGVALLPCHLGDGEPALVRLGPAQPEVRLDLWLLTHPDLRRTARVRAFMEVMGRRLAGEREQLEGRPAG